MNILDYSGLSLFGKEIDLKDVHQVKIIDIIPKYPWKEGAFFIEVGANDGVSNDPIRTWVEEYNWEGVLIEPVPEAFIKLKSNYEGIEKLFFEETAISNCPDKKEAILYVPKATKIASLNQGHPPMKGGKYRSITVRLMTLTEIIRKYKISHLDLLNIDAEGYDFEVIKSLDFNVCKPCIIHYEHRHLGKDKILCEKYLNKKNYALFFNKNNTVAIDKEKI